MAEKPYEKITCKINPITKQKFKLICLRKDETMSDIVEDAIEKYVKENEDLLNVVNFD